MILRLLIPALLAVAHAFAAEPVFEFKDGDRVALIGDAFIEREQYEGWIELAATTRFADRAVTFRNLGWSADTPAGASRAGLSPLQAGREPENEGWRQLETQLATYRPSVLVTGYGMAASLPGGQTAAEFRRDFERLLDAAAAATGDDSPPRFLILGTPPRFLRPGEPDDTAAVRDHRAALAEINRTLRDVAAARGIPFVPLDGLAGLPGLSDNGIHLNSRGYQAAAREIERRLGWGSGAWDEGAPAEALRTAILRKNDWFFHRSRPANMAYIFGFRKAEQGRNAGEIDGFDQLVAEADARIAALRTLDPAAATQPEPPARTESAFAAKTPQPHPRFTVADGYEITLWAENPLLNKPTQMNFDADGHLWVASSEVYPQIEVGQTANDKIIILSDTTGDGQADASTVFAEGLLIPTGILPGDGGCYVGQSTDLLHFADTTGDGKADHMRRVLSGFGTEDTHHNLHTLRRGPDGRIWMNQSIYTRTDTETPHGLLRLRSGGIMRFDPRSERIETVFYGWCNPWGHQFDRYGQSFVTDGAGGAGINWGVPGAMYFTYAGAERILGSISPGGYPKFCGLEIVESPHFPDDWQGSMITCDFRAQRIVRFTITDEGSGFSAQQADDLVRSDDVNFRPIDVKIGPDGALYIADWANPIINHGEVDFRDPRRDREHGRIWRVSRRGAPVSPVRDLAALASAELVPLLVSGHRHEREQAATILYERGPSPDLSQALAAADASSRQRLAALWVAQSHDTPDLALLQRVITDEAPEIRAAAVRVMGDWLAEMGRESALELLAAAVADAHPRVRIEAIRLLARIDGHEPVDLSLRALDQPTDRFLDYALWLNLRDGGDVWLAALLDGRLPLDGREAALDFALANLPPERSIDAIRRLMPKPLPADGSGPWLGLALRTNDPAMIAAVYDQLLDGGFESAAAANVAAALATAVSERQLTLEGDHARLLRLALAAGTNAEMRGALLRLGGTLGKRQFLDPLAATANDDNQDSAIRLAAIEGLSHLQPPAAGKRLLGIVGSDAPPALRRAAALALVRHHRSDAVGAVRSVAEDLGSPVESRAFWQQALSLSGLSSALAPVFRDRPLGADLAALTLQSVPDIDEHADFLAVLREQAGSAADSTYTVEAILKLAELTEERGDAVRGERIYRQPALACIACHAIGGAGGKVGPDMTSIGASAPLDYLIESIVLPAAKVKEGYHSVILETRDGRSLVGQLLRSTAASVVLRDAAGEEITLAADAVVKRTDVGSIMPANLIDPLPEQDRLDLFKFLSELGKPGPFDATKSRAPRVWAVLPAGGDSPAAATATAGDSGLAWVPVTGTVEGRLPADEVATLIGPAKEFFAATKLQLAGPADLAPVFPAGAEPAGLWINGQAVKPGGVLALGPGVHTIVARYPASDSDIRFESPVGTFLPAW